MQTVGILLLTLGIFVMYCGLNGIPVLDTLKALVASPGNARQILADAKAAAAEDVSYLTGALLNYKKGLDVVDPLAVFPVTRTWKQHGNTGTDYAMPVGTPIIAPKGGVVTNIPDNGTLGNTVQLTLPDGYKIVYGHLSAFSKTNGETVKALQVIGLSGGKPGSPGAGSSTGPHLHVHVLNPSGTRIEYFSYINGLAPAPVITEHAKVPIAEKYVK